MYFNRFKSKKLWTAFGISLLAILSLNGVVNHPTIHADTINHNSQMIIKNGMNKGINSKNNSNQINQNSKNNSNQSQKTKPKNSNNNLKQVDGESLTKNLENKVNYLQFQSKQFTHFVPKNFNNTKRLNQLNHKIEQINSRNFELPMLNNYRQQANNDANQLYNFMNKNKIVKYIPVQNWHYKYFTLTHPIEVHANLDSNYGKKDVIGTWQPSYKYQAVPILGVYKVYRRHYHYTRYEIKVGNQYGFVTGNRHFVTNAYYQPAEMPKKHNKNVQTLITKRCGLYLDSDFSSNPVAIMTRGYVSQIAKLFNVGDKSSHITRFLLKNGYYMTADRNYSRIIK